MADSNVVQATPVQATPVVATAVVVDSNAVQATVIGAEAPKQQDMAPGGNMGASLAANFNFEGLNVKQTMKGCFRECLGCEDTSEYKVSNYGSGVAVDAENHMYALEQSSCIQRCCWTGGRSMTINVTTGSEKGGELIVKYKKPCGFPLCLTIPFINPQCAPTTYDVPCCFMLPEMTAVTPQEQKLGTSKYECDMCLGVPKFGYYEEDKQVYYVAPETCCMGACIKFKCGGKGGGKKVYIPFYFRDPQTKEPLGSVDAEDTPQIAKLWSGLKKECCSDADNFAIRFPKGITPERKASLLGMNFLIDAVWFETHKNS